MLHPIKATEWLQINEANRLLLKSVGALPYNDVFEDIWTTLAKIILSYGSRGGGKSETVADKLIKECIESDYFKCYYGRKVFDGLRESSFATLVYCIEKNGLKHDFHYSTANTSSMVITHKSGNKFIPFGSDKADKLKSIKDPSHMWCEEFDQFTFEDFKDLFPALRTSRGANKFYGTFNSYCVPLNHWIIQVFFPDLYTGKDKQQFDALEGVEVLKIFANYMDNYFIDRDDYTKRLQLASRGNLRIFDGIANGAWGQMQNNDPWLHNYDSNVHIREMPYLPTYPIYLSFDFNKSPVTCSVTQMSPQKGLQSSFLHVIDEFYGEMNLQQLCQNIKSKYPNSIMFVTGDASGNSGHLALEELGTKNMTFYTLIKRYLGLSDRQLHINTKNLSFHDSRILCNTMLYSYPNFYIHPKCRMLIEDCTKATVDDKGQDPNKLKKDRDGYKMDMFDNFRYMLQCYFHDYVQGVLRVSAK